MHPSNLFETVLCRIDPFFIALGLFVVAILVILPVIAFAVAISVKIFKKVLK